MKNHFRLLASAVALSGMLTFQPTVAAEVEYSAALKQACESSGAKYSQVEQYAKCKWPRKPHAQFIAVAYAQRQSQMLGFALECRALGFIPDQVNQPILWAENKSYLRGFHPNVFCYR